jgi:hypothetical protein
MFVGEQLPYNISVAAIEPVTDFGIPGHSLQQNIRRPSVRVVLRATGPSAGAVKEALSSIRKLPNAQRLGPDDGVPNEEFSRPLSPPLGLCTTTTEFEEFAARTTNACCANPHDCISGMPVNCHDECAAVLIPMHTACGGFLSSADTDPGIATLGRILNDALALCTRSGH